MPTWTLNTATGQSPSEPVLVELRDEPGWDGEKQFGLAVSVARMLYKTLPGFTFDWILAEMLKLQLSRAERFDEPEKTCDTIRAAFNLFATEEQRKPYAKPFSVTR